MPSKAAKICSEEIRAARTDKFNLDVTTLVYVALTI